MEEKSLPGSHLTRDLKNKIYEGLKKIKFLKNQQTS
jgi:hypothetical protein